MFLRRVWGDDRLGVPLVGRAAGRGGGGPRALARARGRGVRRRARAATPRRSPASRRSSATARWQCSRDGSGAARQPVQGARPLRRLRARRAVLLRPRAGDRARRREPGRHPPDRALRAERGGQELAAPGRRRAPPAGARAGRGRRARRRRGRCRSSWTPGETIRCSRRDGGRGARPHRRRARQLADVLAECVAERDGELYLVLDQMEEYFVYHGRADGGPLRDALADILGRPELRVHVLLGIRDDALAELDAFKGRVPSLFGNVLRLDHLDLERRARRSSSRWSSSRRSAGRRSWRSRRSSPPWSTRSRRAGSSGGWPVAVWCPGRDAARRDRGAVPPARDGAALGGRARAGLGGAAGGDARRARRCRPDRAGSPRARSRRPSRGRPRARRRGSSASS